MALPRRRAGQGDEGPAPGASPPEADWRAHYESENPDAVEAYVRRHPFLVPLLVEAPRRIAEHFGPHRALVLEATVYPDDGSQHLYLRVQVDDSFEEANARHDRLDEEWWLDAMVAARAQLTVDVELT